MTEEVLQRLQELELTPEALEKTRGYLRRRIEKILQPNEKVLICFPKEGKVSIGGMMEQVLRDCGCTPIYWGPDFRWMGLLRQAFESHVSAVVGPPLVVLGLMKMAKATATPLNIHNAFLAGYPYANWMIEGIKEGLDCKIWGCYWIGEGPVIAGFTCAKEAGIHIREDIFEASIRDTEGELVEDSMRGYLTLRYRNDPRLVFDSQETAKMWHQPCSCGCDDARIVETLYIGVEDPNKAVLEDRFLAWTSILDYRVTRDGDDVELELVVFPGGTLPQIHSCIRQTVRTWDPENDVPFCMEKYVTESKKDQ